MPTRKAIENRLRGEMLPFSGDFGSSASQRVLVVGSINVDLYQKMTPSSIKLGGRPIDVTPIKGMTLPAKSFVENQGIAKQLAASTITCVSGQEEDLLMKMDGPFDQKTGGKGANAAAAAGQTVGCELICNFGRASADANKMLLADLKNFGNVDTSRSGFIDGPTGTAYILLFGDNDNCICLLGGANQSWAASSTAEGSPLHTAIHESAAVMLQREVPDRVNVEVARMARALGRPVIMDVGGTDAPLDEQLIPFLSVVAPNESELTFISGVETQVGGEVKKSLVREAVTALKKKFAAAGNASVEVLVTLGSHGSMHFGRNWVMGREDVEYHVGRFPLSTPNRKPKDTTGAGDCYRGSYVAARYGEGRSVAEAMRWAAAAGSLAVEVEGAMPSMPTRKAIEDRAKQTMLPPTEEFAGAAVEKVKGAQPDWSGMRVCVLIGALTVVIAVVASHRRHR